DIRTTHALRLGFRKIKGLPEQDAKLIVTRRNKPYAFVRELWLRTGLSPRLIERLADADAFGSLGLTRRQALWAAKALGRVGAKDDDRPLFRDVSNEIARPRSDIAASLEGIPLSLAQICAAHSVCSPPPCGEGLGVGVRKISPPILPNRTTPLPSPPPQ